MDQPDCEAGEKLPLNLMFSGPDMISNYGVDAAKVEWYQPVHEPGNVFSYPWSLDQLGQAFSALTPLTTNNPAPWRGTDQSTTAYATTWTGTTKESNSSGSVNAETYSLSITVSGTASIEAVQAEAVEAGVQRAGRGPESPQPLGLVEVAAGGHV